MSKTGNDYSSEILSRLFEVIESREGADGETSYTAKLLAAGKPEIARKLGEEAIEVLTATLAEGRGEVCSRGRCGMSPICGGSPAPIAAGWRSPA